MGKLFEGFIIYVVISTIFWKKGGKYSRGDIIQGRILNKEIRYFVSKIALIYSEEKKILVIENLVFANFKTEGQESAKNLR